MNNDLSSKLFKCRTLEDILNILREIKIWEKDYLFTGIPCEIRHAIEKQRTKLNKTDRMKAIEILDSIYDNLESYCNSKCPFLTCPYCSENKCNMFRTFRTSLWKRVLGISDSH